MWEASPELREAQSKRMQLLRQDPSVQEKLRAYLEGPTNPLRDPAVIQKAQEAAAARGFEHLNGGNGKPIAQQQQKLFSMLGAGWSLEYVLRTGMVPHHYKIDIANPTAKVAIEVDGTGHQAKKIMEADRRKDLFLANQGWMVIRVRNEHVTPAVASSILKLSQAITSPTDS
jgi:very-short-patch-repair endonuclease